MRALSRLVLIVAVLVACGPEASEGPGESSDSGITGTVLIGPTCPVETEDEPCPDKPIEAEIRVLRDDEVVTTVRSGADGRFRVVLDPGDYVLEAVEPNPGSPPSARPLPVTVPEGAFVDVDVLLDSGIR
jgi:hypothetical protein